MWIIGNQQNTLPDKKCTAHTACASCDSVMSSTKTGFAIGAGGSSSAVPIISRLTF